MQQLLYLLLGVVGGVGDAQAIQRMGAGMPGDLEDGVEFLHPSFCRVDAVDVDTGSHLCGRGDGLVIVDTHIAGDVVVERQTRRLVNMQQVDLLDEALPLVKKGFRLLCIFLGSLDTGDVKGFLQLLEQVALGHLVGVHL